MPDAVEEAFTTPRLGRGPKTKTGSMMIYLISQYCIERFLRIMICAHMVGSRGSTNGNKKFCLNMFEHVQKSAGEGNFKRVTQSKERDKFQELFSKQFPIINFY